MGAVDLFSFDSEIEKTTRRLRKEAREASARPLEPTLEHPCDTSAFTTYNNPMTEEANAATAVMKKAESSWTTCNP